jgi:ribonuclease HI
MVSNSEVFLNAHRICPKCHFDLRTDDVKAQENHISIYTDGSCLDNPGPGGYCAVILNPDGTHTEVAGGEANTTNNQMELQAAIAALEKYASSARTKLRIVSDSEYLIKGMLQWVPGWERRGWRKADGKPVMNKDLWQRLVDLARPHDIQWVWVKGHDGNQFNELANRRALEEAEKIKFARPSRASAKLLRAEATA